MTSPNDDETTQILDSSEVSAAKSAVENQVTHTTLGQGELGEMMRSLTCSPYVETATHSLTPLEFASSLDDMDYELELQEDPENLQTLAFPSAQLMNFSKEEDGGYTLTFGLLELSAPSLAALIKGGNNIFDLFLTLRK